MQREVAARIGVNESTVINWETGQTRPRIGHWPRVLAFLGYDPLRTSPGTELEVRALRRNLGLSQRELAHRLGLDEGTVRDLEFGRRRATRRTRALMAAFVLSERPEQ